jgi:uncharacterized protein
VIIVPEETPLTEPYWTAAKAGRLVVQECQECGRSWHPPQPSCPYCVSDNYLWRQVAPCGSVLSYTVVRQAAHAAVKESVPYIVALITVEPGITVICNILQADPADVRIGAEVELRLGPTPAGIELVEAFLVDLYDTWTGRALTLDLTGRHQGTLSHASAVPSHQRVESSIPDGTVSHHRAEPDQAARRELDNAAASVPGTGADVGGTTVRSR